MLSTSFSSTRLIGSFHFKYQSIREYYVYRLNQVKKVSFFNVREKQIKSGKSIFTSIYKKVVKLG